MSRVPHGRLPGRRCHAGPELVKRLDVEQATERVVNFINAMTMEIQMLARCCGKSDVHNLEPEDLRSADARGRGDHRHPARRKDPGAVKHVLTAEDVQRLAESGERELDAPRAHGADRRRARRGRAARDQARRGLDLLDPGARPDGADSPRSRRASVPGSRRTHSGAGRTGPAPPGQVTAIGVHVPPPRDAGGLPSPALAGLVRGRAETVGAGPVRPAPDRIEGLPDYGRLPTKLLIGGEWVTRPAAQRCRASTRRRTRPSSRWPRHRQRTSIAPFGPPAPPSRPGATSRPRSAQRILLRIAELIEAEWEHLAKIESHDVGKPIREAALVDLPACWDPWRFYQGLVRAIDGRVLALPRSSFDYVRKEPMGVVGMIIPWNFPLHIACRKGAAALAAGNTVVLKAPEMAPLTSLELGRDLPRSGRAAGRLRTSSPASAPSPVPRSPSTRT